MWRRLALHFQYEFSLTIGIPSSESTDNFQTGVLLSPSLGRPTLVTLCALFRAGAHSFRDITVYGVGIRFPGFLGE